MNSPRSIGGMNAGASGSDTTGREGAATAHVPTAATGVGSRSHRASSELDEGDVSGRSEVTKLRG